MNWSTICVRIRDWPWASGDALFKQDHKIL